MTFTVPQGIKVFLFDMDGTLVNTEPVGPQVFAHQLETYGFSPSDEERRMFLNVWRRTGVNINEEEYFDVIISEEDITKRLSLKILRTVHYRAKLLVASLK